jgi:hypothetical protein
VLTIIFRASILPSSGFDLRLKKVLNFYKEQFVGETIKYVAIRAKASQKHQKRVLVEMVEEARILHQNITTTLVEHPDALHGWRTLENGVMYVANSSFGIPLLNNINPIAWHLAIERYKLAHLDLKW